MLVDGIVTLGCVYQAEAAVFIIAQTIPVLRVLLQSDKPPISSIGSGQSKQKEETVDTRAPSIELVQLPGGRIVAADSDDVKAFKSRQQPQPEQTDQKPATDDLIDAGVVTMASVDDEVHKIWEQMGLSTRAWSK